ncbi:hypothetical protein D2Q93_14110 [Alicyclobacillaceae bacterium I2511]|nr:hypothetical protein D2Q93_14110 [Alicyclobacillaceae bacterium I2511]
MVTMGVAAFSLITGFIAASTVYLWLISIAGMPAVVVWISIPISQINFRREFLHQGGKLSDLKYRTPFYPYVPILAAILNGAVVVSLAFQADQRIALYTTIPFMGLTYLYYELVIKRKIFTKKVPKI